MISQIDIIPSDIPLAKYDIHPFVVGDPLHRIDQIVSASQSQNGAMMDYKVTINTKIERNSRRKANNVELEYISATGLCDLKFYLIIRGE
jgi:hypothetical protein